MHQNDPNRLPTSLPSNSPQPFPAGEEDQVPAENEAAHHMGATEDEVIPLSGPTEARSDTNDDGRLLGADMNPREEIPGG